MLTKTNRLLLDKDFSKLFSRGRGMQEPILALKFLPNKSNSTRFAFIVSTKVSKRAVVRNTIKRRLREAIRVLLPEVLPGFDIALIAKKGADKALYRELGEVTERLLRRCRLYGNSR